MSLAMFTDTHPVVVRALSKVAQAFAIRAMRLPTAALRLTGGLDRTHCRPKRLWFGICWRQGRALLGALASEQKLTLHTYAIEFIDGRRKVFGACTGDPWAFRSD